MRADDPRQMELMSEAWRNGASAKRMAELFCRSPETIIDIARKNRALFPYRRVRVSDAERTEATMNLVIGVETTREVADRLGISIGTAQTWRRNGRAVADVR